jgi:hypothetical protein
MRVLSSATTTAAARHRRATTASAAVMHGGLTARRARALTPIPVAKARWIAAYAILRISMAWLFERVAAFRDHQKCAE